MECHCRMKTRCREWHAAGPGAIASYQRIQPECQYIQMAEKKKKNTEIPRKLKHVKSQDTLPLGTIMDEIGQLRQQLKDLKGKRGRERTQAPPQTLPANKENKSVPLGPLPPLLSVNSQAGVQLELLLGRMNRALASGEREHTQLAVCNLLEEVNRQTKHMIRQREDLLNSIHDLEGERLQNEEKYSIVLENNARLEKQVEQLYGSVMGLAAKQHRVKEEDSHEREEINLAYNEMKAELQQVIKNNLQLQSLAEEWQTQGKGLQDKCFKLEQLLVVKDQQVSALKEDIRYLRAQNDKGREQRRDIEQLWQRSNLQNEERLRIMENKLTKTCGQRDRWMNQCQSRREENSQLQAVEDHKALLFREIQQLRNNYSLKCQQLAECRNQLHQVQKQLIASQSSGYQTQQELQRLRREKEHWGAEVEILRGEVEEYQVVQQRREEVARVKEAAIKGGNQRRQEKMKAFDDIHSLIQQHRSELQNDL